MSAKRQEHDTHCSRCGGALIPVPSFTQMKWECPCQPPKTEMLKVYGGWYTMKHAAYTFGIPFSARVVHDGGKYNGTILRAIKLVVDNDCIECEIITAVGWTVGPGMNIVFWPCNHLGLFEIVSTS